MRKKWGVAALFLFTLYTIALYFYIFHGGGGGIPNELKGTAADPALFMTPAELVLSGELSKIRNFLFFVLTPLEWLIYFFILLFGISRLFEQWATFSNKWKIVRNAAYLFSLLFFTKVLFFPIDYFSYKLGRRYGISTQSFSSWMHDNVLDFWLNMGLTILVVTVLYWLIQKSAKRWWLYAWLLTIPFSIFMMFIQPVVIDPLYNDFYPLKDKELEAKILALAEQANIPAEHVFEVGMADKTNALNAYVTGVGSNSRIVLWDTTLNKLTDDEILFVMAHEMSHYVNKDIYIGMISYILMMLVGLWLTNKMATWIITRYGKLLNIEKISDIRSYPLLLLISSFLFFASSPLSNYQSRYLEIRADEYAIALTGNEEAAISAFQKLTISGLSDVNPPLLVKWFRYTHPPMLDRINSVREENNGE